MSGPMLDELLTPESLALWNSLLYGTSGRNVAVALSQVGNVCGQPYWKAPAYQKASRH